MWGFLEGCSGDNFAFPASDTVAAKRRYAGGCCVSAQVVAGGVAFAFVSGGKEVTVICDFFCSFCCFVMDLLLLWWVLNGLECDILVWFFNPYVLFFLLWWGWKFVTLIDFKKDGSFKNEFVVFWLCKCCCQCYVCVVVKWRMVVWSNEEDEGEDVMKIMNSCWWMLIVMCVVWLIKLIVK